MLRTDSQIPGKGFNTPLQIQGKNDKYYILKLDPKENIHGFIQSMKIWVNVKSYIILKIEYSDYKNISHLLKLKRLILIQNFWIISLNTKLKKELRLLI